MDRWPEHLTVSGRPRSIVLDLNYYPHDPSTVDYLRSEAGSWYLVESARKVRSASHPNRWRFSVLRLDTPPVKAPPDELVIEFFWYPRRRRAR